MEIFTLDGSRINEILYSMENQEKDSYIDINTGKIEFFDKGNNKELSSDLYTLPDWGPIEGFRVMDDFVSSMKNPIVKQELKIVLNSGHGVFRKFKNVIKENPDIQKLWFVYKKKEMKALIISWYNQLRELVGLEILSGDEFDDEQELLGFDFTIEKATEDLAHFIIEEDKKGFYEQYKLYSHDVIEELYERKREGLMPDDFINQDYIFVAKNPAGDATGFVWAIEYVLGNNFKVIELLQLYVCPSYRGLGLGKLLFDKFIEKYNSLEARELVVSCNKNSWIIKHLENSDFNIVNQELSFRN